MQPRALRHGMIESDRLRSGYETRPDFNVLTPSALDRSGEFHNRPSSSHLCYNLIEPFTRERERTENEKYVNYTRFYRVRRL